MICYIIIWDGLMIGAYSPETVWIRPSRFFLLKTNGVRIAAYRVQGAYTHNNLSPDVAYTRGRTRLRITEHVSDYRIHLRFTNYTPRLPIHRPSEMFFATDHWYAIDVGLNTDVKTVNSQSRETRCGNRPNIDWISPTCFAGVHSVACVVPHINAVTLVGA